MILPSLQYKMASQSHNLPPGARLKTTAATYRRGQGRELQGKTRNSREPRYYWREQASTSNSRSKSIQPIQPLQSSNHGFYNPHVKLQTQNESTIDTNWRRHNYDNRNNEHDEIRRGVGTRHKGQERPPYRSSNVERPKGRVRHLNVGNLKESLDKEPTEIVMELATDRSGWKEFLDQGDITRDIVVLLLEIMVKACLCKGSPQNLNSFLAIVCQSSFLSRHLSPFVSSLSSVGSRSSDEVSDEELQPGENIVKLLQTILQCLQTFALDDVRVNAVLLQFVYSSNDKIPAAAKEHVEQLKQMCDDLQKSRENFNEREIMKSHYKPPPDDFRGIHIIPDINEIVKIERPFLRHNLIKGRYQDTEHYLDVQFRLLREDFVAPLREGIGEYLDSKEEFEGNSRRRLQDVRLYHGVKIIRPVMTRGGTGHLIKFDPSPFKKIRWESSKRLIVGSLLCLTKDDFETVIFATVEDRDVWRLQRGEIEVKFIRLNDAIGKASEATFLMAETSAYFESYRYVLDGLKEYSDISLPMKKYIVEASCEANPPTYLLSETESKTYDLRLTAQRTTDDGGDINSQEVKSICDSSVNECTEDEDFVSVLKSGDMDSDCDSTDMPLHHYVQGILRAVNILEPGTWPEPNTLHFDESQLEAFRAALASEFVLIQGPPGTGKTYVGLEIVKTLLFNFHAWCRGESEEDWDFRPILVVCYTNHALDQFLEGIYKYEKDIVRVGGRCKTEILQDICVANIRHNNRKSRNVPDHIRRRRADMQVYYEMREILETAHGRISLAQTGVLSPKSIFSRQIMSSEQYRSLLYGNMYDWLGLDGRGFPKVPSRGQGQQVVNEAETDDGEEKAQVDIAEEAAILAEQRELGNDHIFLQYKEECRDKMEHDFVFVPGKHFRGETRKEEQDRLKLERSIEMELNSSDVMSRDDTSSIKNVWQLSYHQRWRLYRYWVSRFIKTQEDIMLRYQVAYQRLTEMRKEIDIEEDYLILKHSKVIGFTTTGAAKHRALLQRVRPRIIIVEEAAEVLEAHIITTLSQDCQHLILIGDHQQLRPKPTVHRLAKNFHLDVSLFERMINNGMPCYRLGQQHRMRPEISILMREHFYEGLQDHTSVMSFRSVKGVAKNMFFIEHNQAELQIEDNRSKSNLHEARFLVALCSYLLQQGYDKSQITILTTYTGQLFNFKRLMTKDEFDGVRVCVVDNFQGEENEIILLSLVRSNDEGSIGFLNVHNRVCVALSRARKGLFCVGNIRLLATKSPLWKKIMKTITINSQIGPKIPLVCQNHPETVTEVSCPEDFSQLVPDGGCSLRCEARLTCGHVCRLYCHPIDPKHEEYRCMKDCSTTCPRGHTCALRCYQECKCQVVLSKLFERCQHTDRVKCHEIESAICQRPCSRKRSCQHECPAKCGEECPELCSESCTKKMECGHSCRRKCGKPCSTVAECEVLVEVKQSNCEHTYRVGCKDDPKWRSLRQHPPCNVECTRILKCGHKCAKKCHERCECLTEITKTWHTCNHLKTMTCKDATNAVCREQITKAWPTCDHRVQMSCCDAAITVVCPRPCVKHLPCGHRCRKHCGETCEPTECTLSCRRLLSCGHPCRKMCNEPCDNTICTSQCTLTLSCKHICQRKCNEACDVTSCVLPCKRLLPCEHQCQNICNEPCESSCNRQMLKRMTCGHYIEAPCSVDVDERECFKDCLKFLPCGHQCQNRCGVPCTADCKVNEETTIPECGHKVTIACDQEPDRGMCRNRCEMKLKCGHLCQRLCREECEKICTAIITKELPICKHKCKLPCSKDSKSVKCHQSCAKTLPCNHKCVERCGDPCTVQCQVTVRKQHPECGHYFTVLCFEEKQTKISKEPDTIVTVDGNVRFSTLTQPTNWPDCKETVQKKGKCGHQIHCYCCENPDSTLCKVITRKRIRQCGHLVKMKCHEDPRVAVCQEFILKKLPGCGHEKELECHKDPANVSCLKLCRKTLKCGHSCRSTCHPTLQPCEENCRVEVQKQITICGHVVKVRCHVDPDLGLYCVKICEKQLDCGHECKERCGRPCTKICQEILKAGKVLPCKHVARDILCSENPSEVFCQEQCTSRLGCGHECKNVCGECTHSLGRKGGDKIPECAEVCDKLLLCGHYCNSRCRDCFFGRLHRPCRVLIDEILLLCGCKRREHCSKVLSLRHKDHVQFCLLQQRRRQEEEIHYRCEHNPRNGYCKEPCTKLLPCKHTCIGICGEPCIKLCRFCNRREVLKSFPEYKSKTDPCYITLNECDHIIEINELTQKLTMVSQTSGCVQIVPMNCPRCGTSLTDRRFNEYLSGITESVEIIDLLLREEASSELNVVEKLLSESEYQHKTQPVAPQSIRRWMWGYTGMTGVRSGPRTVMRSSQANMAWKLKLLHSLDDIHPPPSGSHLTAEHGHLITRCRQAHTISLQAIKSYLVNILDDMTFLTEQLAIDLGCELERVRWCCGLETLALHFTNDEDALLIENGDTGTEWDYVVKAEQIVTSYRQFTVQTRQAAEEALGTSLHEHLEAIMKTQHTDLGRKRFLDMQQAQMGFLAGDWFKCSRDPDHIFHHRAHFKRGYSASSTDCTVSCPLCEEADVTSS